MIIQWMSFLGPRLLWCTVQVAIFAVVAALLCMRPWSPKSPSVPLLGLVAIFVLTVGVFVPVPGWTNHSLDWAENLALSGNSERFDSPARSGKAMGDSDLGLAHDPNAKRTEVASLKLFSEGWRSWIPSGTEPARELERIESSENLQLGPSKIHFQWIWVAYALPIFVLPLGFFRFAMGILGVRKLKKGSEVIVDPRLDKLLREIEQRAGLLTNFEIRRSPHISSPATTGIRKQILWLPENWKEWTDLELRGILAHEVAHFQNRDHVAQLLAQWSLAFHVYNPMVHWLANRLRLEQEWAADLHAAELLGGSKQYLSLLAELALKHESQPKGFVGWPATQFLGGRTLLRRVEMLGSTTDRSRAVHRALPYAACVGILLLFLGLLGLRPLETYAATVANPPTAEAITAVTQANDEKEEFNLRFLGDGGDFVLAIRPKELLKNTLVRELVSVLSQGPVADGLLEAFGGDISQLEQIIVEGSLGEDGMKSFSSYIQSNQPLKGLERLVSVDGKSSKIEDTLVYEMPDGSVLWFPTPNSCVVRNKKDFATIQKLIEGRSLTSAITRSKAWQRLSKGDALLVANKKQSGNLFVQLSKDGAFRNTVLPIVAPVVQESDYLGVAISVKTNEMEFHLQADAPDEEGCEIVRETLEATSVFAKNWLREYLRALRSEKGLKSEAEFTELTPDGYANNVILDMGDVFQKALKSQKIRKENTSVEWSVGFSSDTNLAKQFSKLTLSMREAARRMSSVNNLKQLALAFHNHHDAFRRFPHSKHMRPNGVHPHSWRIAILPFIEQQAIYDQYKFDEPWDSENNSKLIAKMPSFFRHPSQPDNSTTTDYVVLVGDDAFCMPKRPSGIADITDGTSGTIMLVEAKTNIPWTKPEDFTYDPNGPLPQMGGFDEKGFNAARADGSVFFVAKSIDEKLLRALITARGGEPIASK